MIVKKSFVPWLNWAVVTSFVLFQFWIQSSSGVLASSWMHDFHIGRLAVSNLSAAFFYPYLLMQVPAGLLYDRFGPRVVLGCASLLLGAGCLFLAMTHSYALALLARVVMGFGASFGFVGMLLVSANWFHERHFALMVGLSETLAMLMVALGVNALAWVVVHWGWRWSMHFAAIVALLMMLLSFVFMRKKPKQLDAKVEPAMSMPEQFIRALKSRHVWLAGLYGFFMFAMMNAFTALWGFPFLHEAKHLTVKHAAAVMSMVFVGIAFGAPFSGFIAMRLGKRKPILLASSLLSALVMFVVVWDSHLSLIALYVLLFLAGFVSASYIHAFALTKEFTDSSFHGAALALTNMIFMTSAPILQLLIASLLHWHLGFELAMSVIPVGFLIAACLLFGL